ncbi:hypothetical protein FOA43_003347 [Brettanomyces nanus]|uniref:Cytochrome c oxidase subunit 13, mitochondrial n=1 Tax=Eeniella nana TaxID=13502 RepID=A0A875S2M1_EENNA|nr:uncharacterized protein FOA43_003347 [Brettanomyces nanus]QPG75961.1 hypothetical protein FOA43_003347 [Brettanomyces nanus]
MFRLFATKQTARVFGRRMNSSASKLEKKVFVSQPAEGKKFTKNVEDIVAHSKAGAATWKKITMLMALPAVGLAAFAVYGVEKEHAANRKRLVALPDDQWPKSYPYQNVRKNDFFWGDGDKTLFWNEGVNRHIHD